MHSDADKIRVLYLSAFCEVDFVGKKALRLQVSRKSLYTDLRCYVYGLNCLKSLLSHRGTIMGKSRLYGLLNATPACRYSRKDPNFFARTTIASFLTSKGDQTTRVRIVGSAYESQVQEDSLDADRRKPESIAVGRKQGRLRCETHQTIKRSYENSSFIVRRLVYSSTNDPGQNGTMGSCSTGHYWPAKGMPAATMYKE